MKIQFSIAIGLLALSTVSYAHVRQECQVHVAKAGEAVANAGVLKGVEQVSRSIGQKVMDVILPRPTIERISNKPRQDYVGRGCGTSEEFNRELHAHLESRSHTNFPLASRVACDEIIESAALNRLNLENTGTDVYERNQADFINLCGGTASAYRKLVAEAMRQPQVTSESADFEQHTADRHSRQQMIETARQEYAATNGTKGTR